MSSSRDSEFVPSTDEDLFSDTDHNNQDDIPPSEKLPCHSEIAQEKGASSWLIALPIKKFGFALHKSEFRDAICLRYNWSLDKLPTQCACSSSFSLDHALNCHKGGFRHGYWIT